MNGSFEVERYHPLTFTLLAYVSCFCYCLMLLHYMKNHVHPAVISVKALLRSSSKSQKNYIAFYYKPFILKRSDMARV